MSREVSLSSLRVFEAAARTRSFKLAAVDLSLTPSAVSHGVRKLERELGTTLFARDGRTVSLTHEGKVLLASVERGFAELRRGIEAVSASVPGLLRVHCAPSFAAQWLGPRLPRFLAAHPGVEVRLASGTDYRRFDSFDADIIYGNPPSDATALSLGHETVSPLCTRALAERVSTPADLLGLPLIESDNKRVRWGDWFIANGLEAPARHGPRFDRSFLAIGAAVDGLGVALESLLLADRELASGKLVQPLRGLAQDVIYTGHWLAFPSRRSSSGLSAFVDWLVAELKLPNAQTAGGEAGREDGVIVLDPPLPSAKRTTDRSP